MINKWIGGLKYTLFGRLKAMETTEGWKHPKEVMHDVWKELDSWHQQREGMRQEIYALLDTKAKLEESLHSALAGNGTMGLPAASIRWLNEQPAKAEQISTEFAEAIAQLHKGGYVPRGIPGLFGEATSEQTVNAAYFAGFKPLRGEGMDVKLHLHRGDAETEAAINRAIAESFDEHKGRQK